MKNLLSQALLASCSLSCMAEGGSLGPLPQDAAVVQTLTFVRKERTVSRGFDLDGQATNRRDEAGCYHDDFRSPEGERGIDNNMAHLIPLIDLVAQAAIEPLIQDAVNAGRLLLLIERLPTRDGNITLRFRRGDDQPLVGNHGLLLPDQTLGLHPEPLLGQSGSAMVVDGVYEALVPKLRLPVVIFSTLYVLDIFDARVRFRLQSDGHLTDGLVGGGVETDQILEVIRTADGQVDPTASVEGVVGDSLRNLADLAPVNGACTRISSAFSFEAVPTFVFE